MEQNARVPCEPASISLDDLRQAFADAMQLATTASPAETLSPNDNVSLDGAPSSHGVAPPEGLEPPVRLGAPVGLRSLDESAIDRPVHPMVSELPISPGSIIEALLFVGAPSDAGISSKILTEYMQGVSHEEIVKTVDDLNASYRACGHPWQIVLDGDQYSMQLLESIEVALDRLQSNPKDTTLSQNAIDCLSLIAYRPGITKADLESQWRQNAGATISYLIKKGLVRLEEGDEGAVARYFTTEKFLDILGLQSLDDLPQGDEL